MSLSRRSYTPDSALVDFALLPLLRPNSPLPVPRPTNLRFIQRSASPVYDISVGSTWSGSTAYTSEPTVSSSKDPYPVSSANWARKRSPTPSSLSQRGDPLSNSSSKAGTLSCSIKGCDRLSKTLSEHKRHTARHKLEHVCTVTDCARNGKGFATINDLNRHLKAVHKILVDGARVYRCFVPGCCKREKEWPRKDNFRYHLKRTHPNEDVEDLLKKSEAWWDSQQHENTSTPAPSLRLEHSLEQATSQIRSQKNKADASLTGSKKDDKPYCDTTNLNFSNPAEASWNPLYSTSRAARDLHVPILTAPSQHRPRFSDEGYKSNSCSWDLVPEHEPTATDSSKVEVSGARRRYDSPLLASAVPTATTSKASRQYTDTFPSGTSRSAIPKFYLARDMFSQDPYACNDADCRADPAFVKVEQPGVVPDAFERPIRDSAAEISSELKEKLAQNDNAMSQSLKDLPSEDESRHSDTNLSEEEAAITGVSVTSLDSLKDLTAAHENKSTNENVRAAIATRSALRAQSNIPDAGSVEVIRADDYFERYTDGVGRTVFVCKWPTCADRKQWWNLRSEVKKHVKHHIKPYGCTFDHCYRRFGSKSDWIRHEVKRHTQQAYWRCDLEHPTSPHARNCDEVFLEKRQFFAHLEELHQMTDIQQINKLAQLQLVDAGFQCRYWCGFCKSVRDNRKKGKEGTKARYDHIAKHINVDWRNIDDWVSPSGTLTKQVLRQRRMVVLNPGEDFSDPEKGSLDSEESNSTDGENSELSASGLTVEDNPSTIQRRRVVREQMEAAELTISRKGPRLNEVDAEYTPAIASLSKALRNPHHLSEPPARGRSTSQSSKVGSFDSEGEREFMGSAVDCGTIGGLSPSLAGPGDHELITSIVIELVQAYLQTQDYPHESLRQCTDGSDTSQSQRTTDGSSSLSISRNSAPKGTAGNPKRARQEDDDDDLEEQDNPVKRAKLIVHESENKSFACPYSKYEKARYSEMNTNTCEKKYRRCASSYLTDIPRLKQHLFRTHKRPDSYCARCYEIFKTQHDLEEHSRVHPPCPIVECPFPEKMTHDQRTIIQRRRDLKDQVLVWFYIYETLFPGSIKPLSPYVEVVSVEAAASFQQWYESPEIIANFHERFCSRIAETFPDTSDQFLIQMIHEECLSELASQRGPNFHIDKGEESKVDSLELPGFLPNSSGTGPSFETAGSMSYIGAHATTNSLGMPLHQNDITEPQFAFLASGVGPSCTGNNGTDARVQESLPTLDVSSRSPSDTFEELEKLPPHDHLQDQYDFSMTDHYSSDFPGISGNGILTIDASDAEDFHAAGMDDQTEDGLSRKQRGKRRAYS